MSRPTIWSSAVVPVSHLLLFAATIRIAPVVDAVDVKIGALFDYNTADAQQMFRHAIAINNNMQPDAPGSGAELTEEEAAAAAEATIKLEGQAVEIAYGNEFAASKRLCRLLRNGDGVTAIFGPIAPGSSQHCLNICDAKDIPYVDFRSDADTWPPVVNMMPHPDAMAQLFVDLVQAWGWKGFTILYESAPWLPRVAELLQLYDPKEYTVTVRRINRGLTDDNYRSVLRRVRLSSDVHILLECSIDVLAEVLKQAQQVGLMTDRHQLIIASPDMHTIDLEPFQYSGTNITGVRMVNPENPMVVQVAAFMADAIQAGAETGGGGGEGAESGAEASAEGGEASAEAASGGVEVPEGLTAEKMRTQTALIFDAVLLLMEALKQLNPSQIQATKQNCNNMESWENGNSITNFMRNTMVHGMTGEVRFDNEGLRTKFSMDIIELTSSGLITVGQYNASDGLHMARKEEPPAIVDNASLRNKTFVVITALSAPYGMLRDSAQQLTGNERFEGFGIDLIHELSLMLGFNYTFVLQEDGVYGSQNNVTKEWSGMMREIIQGRADLGITDLTITSERESGVDFTMPFMNLGISILFRKPTKQPPSTFSFMSPFSTEVWMYLGGAYLSVSLCLFVLGRISPLEWDNPYPCIEEPTELENQFSLRNALWFTIGALLQQGSEIAPKAPSTRAVASIWWFFTLIIVSSYTANLAAFLTVESLTSVLNSAEGLRDCYLSDAACPVQFGAKRGGSTLNFFKEAEHGTYKNMFTYMDAHPELLTGSNDEGLKWTQENRPKNYAFLMESSSIEYIIERNCDVTQVGGLLDDKGYGIAMRKNSEYRSALSEAVLRLQEQGILTTLKIKWWKEKKGGGACADSGDDGGALALEVANVEGVFLLLIVGSVAAIICSCVEMILDVLSRAMDNKVPFREEFLTELKFVARCHGNTKTVRHRKSSSHDSKGSKAEDGDAEEEEEAGAGDGSAKSRRSRSAGDDLDDHHRDADDGRSRDRSAHSKMLKA